MSVLTVNVIDPRGSNIKDITLSSEFYIQYDNTNTGKTVTSEVLFSTKATSDDNGVVSFGITPLTNRREFIKYWELYLSEGGDFSVLGKTTTYPDENHLSITVTVTYDLSKVAGDVTFDSKTGIYTFPTISAPDTVNLVSLGDSKFELDTLEDNYKKAEKDYLFAKNLYQENLKIADTSKIFEKLTPYEPASWEVVLTRLLEFEEGTLDAGLRFAKKAGLTEEYRRLDAISTAILYIKNLYPNITLDNGEGIPYDK